MQVFSVRRLKNNVKQCGAALNVKGTRKVDLIRLIDRAISKSEILGVCWKDEAIIWSNLQKRQRDCQQVRHSTAWLCSKRLSSSLLAPWVWVWNDTRKHLFTRNYDTTPEINWDMIRVIKIALSYVEVGKILWNHFSPVVASPPSTPNLFVVLYCVFEKLLEGVNLHQFTFEFGQGFVDSNDSIFTHSSSCSLFHFLYLFVASCSIVFQSVRIFSPLFPIINFVPWHSLTDSNNASERKIEGDQEFKHLHPHQPFLIPQWKHRTS